MRFEPCGAVTDGVVLYMTTGVLVTRSLLHDLHSCFDFKLKLELKHWS